MYSEKFTESLKAVEAAREKNIALEPERMTAKQKEDLLAALLKEYDVDEESAKKDITAFLQNLYNGELLDINE